MTDTQPTPPAASPRSSALALGAWIGVVALALGIVAYAMGWIAGSTDISSPVATAEEVGEAAGATTESGHPVPDFRLATLDGERLGPPDFPGEVVVIDFWATWCGPCRLQAKFLEEVHAELDGDGVRFFALDVGEDEQTVRSYVERTPFPYTVLLDPQETVSRRYGILGLPTLMIVDPRGEITYLETGVVDAKTLRRMIEAAKA
jgi:thiol-disulfide isomerase/thioredoxin